MRLPPRERRDERLTDDLLAAISAGEPAILDLAARLVETPSDWPAHDERAVVRALQRAGAAMELPRGEIVATTARRPNLLIRLGAHRPGPSLLLVGHTDTKPAGDVSDWAADPYRARVHDGMLHGLGAADMKGGLAAMLHAAAAARSVGLPRRGELVLAFTADEEASGTLGLAALMAAGLRTDFAVIGEPSGLATSFDTLPLGSRGYVGFTLRARGPRIHSALSDRIDGSTAIAALVRVLDGLPRAVDFGVEPAVPFGSGLTFNPATWLEAGVASGIDPAIATARGDVRTIPGMTRESVGASILAGLERLGAGPGGDLDVELELDPEDWPASTIDPASPVVAALERAAARVLGRTPALGAFPGASEAHVLAAHGVACIPAFGPGLLRVAHVPGEHVPVADLTAAASIYALLVGELLG
jgi:succinyl-diaminopimelate desuccinylase